MGIAYDPTIPSTGGRPSAQYLDIRDNFASIQTLIDIDHVDFSSPNYGKHAQVTLANVTSPGAQSNPQSVIYSKPGIASTGISDVTFKNQNGVFVLDLIRAFVKFDNNGNILSSQSMNVTSVTKVIGINAVDIVFDPNAVVGQTFSVFVSVNANATYSFSITGNNTVRVSYSTNTIISVIALQL